MARGTPRFVVVFEASNTDDAAGEATEVFGTHSKRELAEEIASKINDAVERQREKDPDTNVHGYAFVRQLHSAPVTTCVAIIPQLMQEEANG